MAYVFANATISLGPMLSSYPGPLQLVFAQFPDPHFKKRHHKRRIFQPQLVQAVTEALVPGGEAWREWLGGVARRGSAALHCWSRPVIHNPARH